jgi:hypothetical protein
LPPVPGRAGGGGGAEGFRAGAQCAGAGLQLERNPREDRGPRPGGSPPRREAPRRRREGRGWCGSAVAGRRETRPDRKSASAIEGASAPGARGESAGTSRAPSPPPAQRRNPGPAEPTRENPRPGQRLRDGAAWRGPETPSASATSATRSAPTRPRPASRPSPALGLTCGQKRQRNRVFAESLHQTLAEFALCSGFTLRKPFVTPLFHL